MYAVTDYSLARRAVLEDLRAGRVTRSEVCDAQQELLRAARNYGDQAPGTCPVCEGGDVVVVAFVFGDRLARNNGRVIAAEEIARYVAIDGVRCYCVEVCLECCWNHLRRSYLSAPATDVPAGSEPRVT